MKPLLILLTLAMVAGCGPSAEEIAIEVIKKMPTAVPIRTPLAKAPCEKPSFDIPSERWIILYRAWQECTGKPENYWFYCPTCTAGVLP